MPRRSPLAFLAVTALLVVLCVADEVDDEGVEQHGLTGVRNAAVKLGELGKMLMGSQEWIYFWILMYFAARNGWGSAGY